MNPILIVVTVVGKGGNRGLVWRIIPPTYQFAIGSLQVVRVPGAHQHWLSDNVFCDVQLKPAYQREDTTHVTLVDVDFLKPHV